MIMGLIESWRQWPDLLSVWWMRRMEKRFWGEYPERACWRKRCRCGLVYYSKVYICRKVCVCMMYMYVNYGIWVCVNRCVWMWICVRCIVGDIVVCLFVCVCVCVCVCMCCICKFCFMYLIRQVQACIKSDCSWLQWGVGKLIFCHGQIKSALLTDKNNMNIIEHIAQIGCKCSLACSQNEMLNSKTNFQTLWTSQLCPSEMLL